MDLLENIVRTLQSKDKKTINNIDVLMGNVLLTHIFEMNPIILNVLRILTEVQFFHKSINAPVISITILSLLSFLPIFRSLSFDFEISAHCVS